MISSMSVADRNPEEGARLTQNITLNTTRTERRKVTLQHPVSFRLFFTLTTVPAMSSAQRTHPQLHNTRKLIC